MLLWKPCSGNRVDNASLKAFRLQGWYCFSVSHVQFTGHLWKPCSGNMVDIASLKAMFKIGLTLLPCMPCSDNRVGIASL